MSISTTKSSTVKEFNVSSDECVAKFKLYMTNDILDKAVIIFPRENGYKIVTILPEEINLILESLSSIDKSILPNSLTDKIKAIKEFRTLANCGLLDAKNSIEYIMDFGFDIWKNKGYFKKFL